MKRYISYVVAVLVLLTATAFAVNKAQEPRYKLGITYQPAMVITVVAPGSLAERHGLVKGDVVLGVGDSAPETPATFAQAVGRALEEKGTVTLQVFRATPEGAKSFTLTIAR